ncbi:MAG: NfeD family protein [Candidatus Ranarchaeia archaeon]
MKVIVVMGLMAILTFTFTFLLVEPFLALIMIGIISTMMVLAFDPATGKAMAQLVIPLTLIFFFVELLFLPALSFEWWQIVIVAGILYLMFFLFSGGGGHSVGGLSYSKVSIKFAPIYGAILIVATLADPRGYLSVLIMVGTVLALMGLYYLFLRAYDEWPSYRIYEPGYVVVVEDLAPRGKVKLGQEIWWAASLDGVITRGEKVVVESITGLTLKVRRPKKNPISHERDGDA